MSESDEVDNEPIESILLSVQDKPITHGRSISKILKFPMKRFEAQPTTKDEFNRSIVLVVSTIEGRPSQLDINGCKIDARDYPDKNGVKFLIDALMAYDPEFSCNYLKKAQR